MTKLLALKALERLFDASEKTSDSLADYYTLKEFLLRPEEKPKVVLLQKKE